MKKLLLCLMALTFISVQADMKEVFKRIPKKFDAVIKLDLQKVMNMPLFKTMTEGDKEFEEMQTKIQESIGLTEKDVLQVYLCGNSTQFWDLEDFANIKFDSMLVIELAKPLDFDKLKEKLPKEAEIKDIEGVKCISVENKQMRNPHAAFLTPKIIAVCPDYCLKEVLTLKPEECILTNRKMSELLQDNGFGGIFSVVHTGAIKKVPPMFPWLKDYRGGVLNVYFDQSKGLEAELTTNYFTVESVKNASMMVSLGLNLMDAKPEIKKFKEMVSFRTRDNNLYVDFKMDPIVWKGVEEMLNLNMDKMKKGRQVGRSWRNMNQLNRGIIAYTKENEGKLPNSLNDMADYVENFEDLIICPATDQKVVYIKAVNNVNDSEDPGKVVILQAKLENGTLTGYLNGQVRMVRDKQQAN